MQKEYLKFSDSTIFEGMTSIRAIIKANEEGINDRKISKILYDVDKMSKIHKEIGYLKAISKKHGFDVYEEKAEILDELALGNSHGGIIAICRERTIEPLSENTPIKPRGFYTLIQGIEDPYNFGYAIRSLYACGADGIILPPRNWMSAAGIVCRSSAGASELFKMMISESVEDAISIFKKEGYTIVCADEKTDNILGETPLPLPILLIVGGEKRGISRSILDLCDIKVKINYAREFKASLSAASATTMFAYEIQRQNS